MTAAPDRAAAVPLVPLKVVHCYSANWYGGLEAMLTTLARCRDLAPGLEPEFALCFDGRLTDELTAVGVPVHRLGPVRFSRPWTVLRARRHLARVLAARRPDVVVCHESWVHALAASTARRAGFPVAFWMHGVPIGTRWYERLARRTPPELVVVNSHFLDGMRPRLFPGAAGRVLYYPVTRPPALPPGTRAAVRREVGTDPDAVVIVQHSRLSAYKGHRLWLDALARLADRPGWEAWLAGGPQQPGEDAYFAELKARAAAAGLAGRVRFLGQRYDIPRLLGAADLHCQPNTGPEPFGIAWIEALHAGLPVVSTRMGGAAEIVTATCGVLVEPGDAAGLAAALAELIADPAARARLGAAGPARAAALTDPAVAMPRLHALLAEVAAGARRPAWDERVRGRAAPSSRGRDAS